jgi:hypothetical protein
VRFSQFHYYQGVALAWENARPFRAEPLHEMCGMHPKPL